MEPVCAMDSQHVPPALFLIQPQNHAKLVEQTASRAQLLEPESATTENATPTTESPTSRNVDNVRTTV
jgi:hypothetical protein